MSNELFFHKIPVISNVFIKFLKRITNSLKLNTAFLVRVGYIQTKILIIVTHGILNRLRFSIDKNVLKQCLQSFSKVCSNTCGYRTSVQIYANYYKHLSLPPPPTFNVVYPITYQRKMLTETQY
jgi:hypothetical protein